MCIVIHILMILDPCTTDAAFAFLTVWKTVGSQSRGCDVAGIA